MRERYQNKLKELNVSLFNMCNIVIEQISNSFVALKNHDLELAKSVIEKDTEVDSMEKEIENDCLHIMLREQPVAIDFRRVSAALKVITDIERIGDHAEDIASLVIDLQGHSYDVRMINDMASVAKTMLKSSVEAYIKEDYELCQNVISMDDTLDSMFSSVKKELSTYMIKNNVKMDDILSLFMISKYLERIGDHAVNISEWVMYTKHIQI